MHALNRVSVGSVKWLLLLSMPLLAAPAPSQYSAEDISSILRTTGGIASCAMPDGRVALYGGNQDGGSSSDLRMFDPTAAAILRVVGVRGNQPQPLSYAMMTQVSPDACIMFSGYPDTFDATDGTWLLNTTSWAWTRLSTPASNAMRPQSLDSVDMTYWQGDKSVYLFGSLGFGDQLRSNRLFKFSYHGPEGIQGDSDVFGEWIEMSDFTYPSGFQSQSRLVLASNSQGLVAVSYNQGTPSGIQDLFVLFTDVISRRWNIIASENSAVIPTVGGFTATRIPSLDAILLFGGVEDSDDVLSSVNYGGYLISAPNNTLTRITYTMHALLSGRVPLLGFSSPSVVSLSDITTSEGLPSSCKQVLMTYQYPHASINCSRSVIVAGGRWVGTPITAGNAFIFEIPDIIEPSTAYPLYSLEVFEPETMPLLSSPVQATQLNNETTLFTGSRNINFLKESPIKYYVLTSVGSRGSFEQGWTGGWNSQISSFELIPSPFPPDDQFEYEVPAYFTYSNIFPKTQSCGGIGIQFVEGFYNLSNAVIYNSCKQFGLGGSYTWVKLSHEASCITSLPNMPQPSESMSIVAVHDGQLVVFSRNDYEDFLTMHSLNLDISPRDIFILNQGQYVGKWRRLPSPGYCGIRQTELWPNTYSYNSCYSRIKFRGNENCILQFGGHSFSGLQQHSTDETWVVCPTAANGWSAQNPMPVWKKLFFSLMPPAQKFCSLSASSSDLETVYLTDGQTGSSFPATGSGIWRLNGAAGWSQLQITFGGGNTPISTILQTQLSPVFEASVVPGPENSKMKAKSFLRIGGNSLLNGLKMSTRSLVFVQDRTSSRSGRKSSAVPMGVRQFSPPALCGCTSVSLGSQIIVLGGSILDDTTGKVSQSIDGWVANFGNRMADTTVIPAAPSSLRTNFLYRNASNDNLLASQGLLNTWQRMERTMGWPSAAVVGAAAVGPSSILMVTSEFTSNLCQKGLSVATIETWLFDLTNMRWSGITQIDCKTADSSTAIVPSSVLPPSDTGMAVASWSEGRVILTAGVSTCDSGCNSIWVWTPNSQSWTVQSYARYSSKKGSDCSSYFEPPLPASTQVIHGDPPPMTAYGGSCSTESGSAIFFGGQIPLSADFSSDMHIIGPSGHVSKISSKPASIWPSARHSGSLACLSETRVVLFGGQSETGILSDVWVFHISNGQQQTSAIADSKSLTVIALSLSAQARAIAPLAASTAAVIDRAHVMLFGGVTPSPASQLTSNPCSINGKSVNATYVVTIPDQLPFDSYNSTTSVGLSPSSGQTLTTADIVGIALGSAVFGIATMSIGFVWHRRRLRKQHDFLEESLRSAMLKEMGGVKVDSVTIPSSVLIQRQNLDVGARVAAGGSGAVYKGRWQGVPVAVKELYETAASSQMLESFANEASTLVALRHRNVISFYGVVYEPPQCMFVQEWAARGDLYRVLHPPDGKSPPALFQRMQMALDAARGLAFLHHKGVVHRDVKSLNFLVTKSWQVKVADFGVAVGAESSSTLTSQVGTMLWLSPEAVQGKRITAASDVYAFGLVLWEIMTCEDLFVGVNRFQLPMLVMNGMRPALPGRDMHEALGEEGARTQGLDIWQEVPLEVVDLIESALDCAQEGRPDMQTVVGVLEQSILEWGRGEGSRLSQSLSESFLDAAE